MRSRDTMHRTLHLALMESISEMVTTEVLLPHYSYLV
jgi:hypothetical protein